MCSVLFRQLSRLSGSVFLALMWASPLMSGIAFKALADMGPPAMSAVAPNAVYGADQFSKGPAPAWVSDIGVPNAQPSVEPNTLRIADMQLRWDGSGRTAYFRRVVVANTSSGVPQLGQVQLDFNPQYQSLVLHTLQIRRDTKVINKIDSVSIRFLERELGLEKSVYDGATTAALLIDDVRVGDALEISYSVHGANPVFKGAIMESSLWETNMPTVLRRIIVQTPLNRPVNFKFLGADEIAAQVKPQSRVHDGMREIEFQQRDIGPFRVEESYPVGYQPFTWLQLSEYKNWNEVAVWAADLFQVPADNGEEFDALVRNLRAVPDVQQRLAKALDFVQSEIRYTSVSFGENSHRPALPAIVMERRFGDCKDKTILLVALYRALGFDVQPVLVAVAAHNNLNRWLPSVAPFDHAIVKLVYEGKTYWLDATMEQKPHNLEKLGKLHGGSDVLVVSSQTRDLETIQQWTPEPYVVHELVKLNSLGGEATLEKITTVSGVAAEGFRHFMTQTPSDQIKKELINDVQRLYAESDWIGDLRVSDDPDKNILSFSSKFKIPHFAEKDPSGWVLRHSPAYIASFFKLPDSQRRSAPYALSYPVSIDYSHEIILPSNILVQEPEEILSSSSAYFKLQQNVRKLGTKIQVQYSFNTSTAAVPANDMGRFIADLRQVQNQFHLYVIVRDNPKWESATPVENDPEKLRASAEAGDAAAQYELGRSYVRGMGVQRDMNKAYEWWLKSASQGNRDGQFGLALMFDAGEGVNQSFSSALVWYRKAAEQNDARAQHRIGQIFAEGLGVNKDPEEAVIWWKKAADQGYASAQVELSTAYSKGLGVKKDGPKALQLLKLAAAQNSPIAANNIGVFYEFGLGGCSIEMNTAREWYRKAADQGYATAQFNMGRLMLRGTKTEAYEAYDWLLKAGLQEHVDAEYLLGYILQRGEGNRPFNFKEAKIWLSRAAANDSPEALFALGEMYELGIGVPANQLQANSFYEYAADLDYAKAQYVLGLQYAPKLNSRDQQRAYEFFSRALRNGMTAAEAPRKMAASKLTSLELDESNNALLRPITKARRNNLVPPKLQADALVEYPTAARNKMLGGEVLLNITVDVDGSVAGVLVSKSSGVDVLDQAAQQSISRYKFMPAQSGKVEILAQAKLKISFSPTNGRAVVAQQ